MEQHTVETGAVTPTPAVLEVVNNASEQNVSIRNDTKFALLLHQIKGPDDIKAKPP